MNETENKLQESFKYNDGVEKYIKFMREIKSRLALIEKRADITFPLNENQNSTEFICLQFRFIMELILLANLATHQNYYKEAIKAVRKMWNFVDIRNYLNGINSEFYPEASIVTYPYENKNHPLFTKIEKGFLTIEDAGKMYFKCSQYLHAKNPFALENDGSITKSFDEWVLSIKTLLTAHNFYMIDKFWMLTIEVDFQAPNTMEKSDVVVGIWNRDNTTEKKQEY